MPIGGRDSYFLRGAHPEEWAPTLDGALSALQRFWLSRPSLRKNQIGNMVIELTILSQKVSVEITNPLILDAFLGASGPQAIIADLAKNMGIPPADARKVLDEAEARVRVDTVRIPYDQTAWKPGVGLNGEGAPSVEDALPKATPFLITAVIKEEDKRTQRAPGERRSKLAKEMIKYLVISAQKENIGDTKLAQMTGLPRTTLRDERYKLERAKLEQVKIPKLKRGQRYSELEIKKMLLQVRKTRGNVTKAARQLKMSRTSLRDIVKRTKKKP
jgi:DNA-binding protein Fis